MKLFNLKKSLAIAISISSLMMGQAFAQNAEIKERTLKFAYVQPKGSHMGFGVEKFAELVAKKKRQQNHR